MNVVLRCCSVILLLAFCALPQSVSACAACFGKSDSKLAEGMNMGILSLLVVVSCVLIAIAAFFVFLARRAAAMPDSDPASLSQTHSNS